jgi:hypothetical protein
MTSVHPCEAINQPVGTRVIPLSCLQSWWFMDSPFDHRTVAKIQGEATRHSGCNQISWFVRARGNEDCDQEARIR